MIAALLTRAAQLRNCPAPWRSPGQRAARDTAPLSPTPTRMPQVGDRCSECDDDHLDILQDRPFSFAPFNPASDNENYNAPYANAKDGLRGIKDPASMRPGAASPETAGTYTVQWQFVPCGTTHEQCGQVRACGMGACNIWGALLGHCDACVCYQIYSCDPACLERWDAGHQTLH